MIEYDICYINDFLKWIISRNTIYIVRNKYHEDLHSEFKKQKKKSLKEQSLGTKGERRS